RARGGAEGSEGAGVAATAGAGAAGTAARAGGRVPGGRAVAALGRGGGGCARGGGRRRAARLRVGQGPDRSQPTPNAGDRGIPSAPDSNPASRASNPSDAGTSPPTGSAAPRVIRSAWATASA